MEVNRSYTDVVNAIWKDSPLIVAIPTGATAIAMGANQPCRLSPYPVL
jgi:hypothetical protein